MDQIKTDVLIIGAGVAGCTAALALSSHCKVTIVDKLARPSQKAGDCLAPAAKRILRKLDIADIVESHETVSPHLLHKGTRSYWGSDEEHFADPLKNPDGFGWHLDREVFEENLRKKVESRGVRCLWPARLYSAEEFPDDWSVQFQSGNDLTQLSILAKVVIDASGRQAHFAKKLGIKRRRLDRLVACWATISNVIHHQVSTISATAEGWWYSAPLSGDRRLVAFHSDSDLIRHRLTTDPHLFYELMQSNQVLKGVTNEKNQMVYHGTVAADSSFLEQFCGDGWAALGDAATSFDPLSSQGMFHAMASATQLAALLTQQTGRISLGSVVQQAYSGQIHSIWNRYLAHRTVFYGQEQRWRNAEFWRRRHAYLPRRE